MSAFTIQTQMGSQDSAFTSLEPAPFLEGLNSIVFTVTFLDLRFLNLQDRSFSYPCFLFIVEQN